LPLTVKAITAIIIDMQNEYKDLINAGVMFAIIGMLLLVI
jgi:hypothetical protein